jgi:phospholipid N-methyltransferase
MPTLDWLKKEYYYGYSSGNVLSRVPGITRIREELKIGGSYRNVFFRAIFPYIKSNSNILELGPGRGSWTRAMLEYIPAGELHTLDFQDVTPWLKPERYGRRLICNQVHDNSFSSVPDNYFDFFWSFGVLCHNNIADIKEILRNALSKMKSGGVSVHMYGDWDKLNVYGWKRGGVPLEFQNKPDEEIWWPRNTKDKMSAAATEAGWSVITADLNLVKRDSIIVLKKQ